MLSSFSWYVETISEIVFYGASIQAAAEEYLHGKIRILVLWEIACRCKTTDDILGPKVWRGLIETFTVFGVESCEGLFHAHRLNHFMNSTHWV